MRILAVALVALLGLIQYPLWLGKGGWLRVWEMDRQLVAQQAANHRSAERNAALEGEVRDLRDGLFAVEERARYELGMVRPDEVFVQIYPTDDKHHPQPATDSPVKTPGADARAGVHAASFSTASRHPAR